MLTLGVLVSGSGTNLQAILERVADGSLDARIGIVISNRPAARALERAGAAHVPTRVIDHRTFASREEFDRSLVDALRAVGVDLVVLAGFDRLLTPVVLGAFPQRVINIHPALLPAFKGLHAHREAVEYGVRVSGATVHFVDDAVDHGPIILQGAVAVDPDDTPETLGARILEVEHQLYPAAIQLIAEGRVEVVGRRVHVRGREAVLPPPLVRRW